MPWKSIPHQPLLLAQETQVKGRQDPTEQESPQGKSRGGTLPKKPQGPMKPEKDSGGYGNGHVLKMKVCNSIKCVSSVFSH